MTHAAMVQVRKVDGEWSDVMVALPGGGGRTVDGWMRTADLLQSAGMAAFWNTQFEPAASLLDREIRATTDAAIAQWLQFYLGLHAVGDGEAGRRAGDVRRDCSCEAAAIARTARLRRDVPRGLGRRRFPGRARGVS